MSKNSGRFDTVENPLTARIPVRCTIEQKDIIRSKAELCGLSMSEYMRRLAIADQIESKADLVAMAELQKMGGLLKHFYNVSGGMHKKETLDAVIKINTILAKMARG